MGTLTAKSRDGYEDKLVQLKLSEDCLAYNVLLKNFILYNNNNNNDNNNS